MQERQYCIREGLKSNLAIPLAVGGSILGVISFSAFRALRPWPDPLVQRLRLIGEIFANALMRKRTEEALRNSEERYRTLLETTHAVPWEADAGTFQFRYVGPQAVALLGYPLTAWYSQDFWMAHLHPDDREEAVRFCLAATRRGQDHTFEYRMIAASGATVWIQDLVSVVREDGAPQTVRGVMIDITERKRAEEEFRRQREELAHVARVTAIGELTASLAHELNQPLTAILTNAQVAQRLLAGPDPPLHEVRAALADISEDDKRAAEVIRRLRMMLKKEDRAWSRLDLNALIQEVAGLVRSDALQRKIAVKLDLAPALPPVLGDRIQLQQVVLNLIINGFEAMSGQQDGRSELLVRTFHPAEGAVGAAIRDQGIGLAEETLGRIFEAFFTTKPQGLGMGLSICRSIIQAHGGRLWATRNPDRGATFHFTLPAEAGEPP